MMELTPLVGLGILIAGVLFYLVYSQSGQKISETALAKLDTRMDEQGKRGDALAAQLAETSRVTQDVVRSLDQDLRAQQTTTQQTLIQQLADSKHAHQRAIHDLQEAQLLRFSELQQQLEQRHTGTFKTLQTTLQNSVDRSERQFAQALERNAKDLGKRMDALTESTDKRLFEISGQVDKRLSEGFEKTVATFADVQKRLELIDAAQKRITELSTSVVSLQEVLADRTSRGTFGEVQLLGLISNVLPEASYRMQHTLSNGKCVDCMLFLPEPTGPVPIDSKFPLENYRLKADPKLAQADRDAAEKKFARNVATHIKDIADKYILPGETADFAIMFVPAEAIFSDIHNQHPQLVEQANRSRVFITSPTTLWAILTTAGAVLKDAATREQVGIIQEHLRMLGGDFKRFQDRMDHLAQHIDQAHRDVDLVHKSARKISSRFTKIERLELGDSEPPALDNPEPPAIAKAAAAGAGGPLGQHVSQHGPDDPSGSDSALVS